MKALWKAVQHKRPAHGLIHHSDRGSQYCAHAYLSHMPVLIAIKKLHLSRLETFAITVVISTIISTLTYLYIEKPSINFGRRLLEKMRRNHSLSQ